MPLGKPSTMRGKSLDPNLDFAHDINQAQDLLNQVETSVAQIGLSMNVNNDLQPE